MLWPRLREIVNDLRPLRSLPAWLGSTGGRFRGRWTYVVAPRAVCIPLSLSLTEVSNLVSCCFNTQINCPQILCPRPPPPYLSLPLLGWPLRYSTVFTLNFIDQCEQRVAHAYPFWVLPPPLPCARSASLPQCAALSLTRLIGNWFYAQLTDGPELHTLPVCVSLTPSLPHSLLSPSLYCNVVTPSAGIIASVDTLKNLWLFALWLPSVKLWEHFPEYLTSIIMFNYASMPSVCTGYSIPRSERGKEREGECNAIAVRRFLCKWMSWMRFKVRETFIVNSKQQTS